MAIRLEKAGWSNAEFWLRRQTGYDLAQARKGEHRIKIKPYPPLVTAQEASNAIIGTIGDARPERKHR